MVLEQAGQCLLAVPILTVPSVRPQAGGLEWGVRRALIVRLGLSGRVDMDGRTRGNHGAPPRIRPRIGAKSPTGQPIGASVAAAGRSRLPVGAGRKNREEASPAGLIGTSVPAGLA